VTYLRRVPTYRYLLPCNHYVRSYTRSMPDAEGLHWFICPTCHRADWVAAMMLVETRPLDRAGRPLQDRRLAARYDRALWLDRIADQIRELPDAPMEFVAGLLGVDAATVRRVGLELGAYRPDDKPWPRSLPSTERREPALILEGKP
jgi:hypothetical protein